MKFRGKSVRLCFGWSSDRSFMVDPLSYFSFQPVFHNWCKKGHVMCYPVYVKSASLNKSYNISFFHSFHIGLLL